MDINSEKLKSLRDEKLWSQDELAIAAGLSLRTIQRAEREGVASLQSLKAIAAALNVDSGVIRDAKVVLPSVANQAVVTASNSDTTEQLATLSAAASANAVGGAEKKEGSIRYRGWAIAALLLIVVAIVLTVVVRSGEPVDRRTIEDLAVTDRPEDMPFGERILGHWESSSSGVLATLDVDKQNVDMRDEARIKTKYSLLDNAISYRLAGRIVSAQIVFDSPTEMVWTTEGTNAVIRYTRNKIVMPSRREMYASMKGAWLGTGDIRSLEVEPEKLRMTMADGKQIDSVYTIDGLRISLNLSGAIQRYAVTFGASGQMTWTKVFAAEGYAFVRAKP